MRRIRLKNVDETILAETLDNGLQVFMWVNEKSNNFFASLNVKYGSIDTEFKINGINHKVPNGIAHFLEHVNFNMPDGSTAHEHYTTLGSSINAFTTFDYTSYHLISNDKFKENIEYLLDYVFTPHFTKELITKEKGIITEEISMYDDLPDQDFYYKIKEGLYQKDKSKISILGIKDDIKEITKENLELVFDTFYHPKNMFLVITGNFNPKEAITMIKENMSHKEFIEYKNPKKKKIKEPIPVNIEYQEIYHNIEIPRIKIAFKMARKNFKNIDNLTLQIYLHSILKMKFGSTSILKEELQKNNLITGGISFNANITDEIVILQLTIETEYPNEIKKIIEQAIKELTANEDDLRRIRKINIAANVLVYDDIELVANSIQDDIITYKKIIDNIYDIFYSLDLKTTIKIIKEIDSNNSATVVLYPKKKTEE